MCMRSLSVKVEKVSVYEIYFKVFLPTTKLRSSTIVASFARRNSFYEITN